MAEQKPASSFRKRLIVGPAPHLHMRHGKREISTTNLMKLVCIALLFPTAGGIYFFGLNALFVVLTSVITCVLTEYIAKMLRKQEFRMDYSAVVTGLLFALVLPPTLPLWMVVIGAAFSIAIVKEAFGGLGYNIFNPALGGRAFLAVCFAVAMTTWTAPVDNPLAIDAATTATPLGSTFVMPSTAAGMNGLYMDMFIGNIGGCIGETSALLILLGAALLLFTGIIKWHIPVVFIGTVAVLSWVMGADPLFQILAGGLMLGAFFMATDYVSAPMTRRGQMIFAIGAGVIVVLVRLVGTMPEGVCFSILLMNAVTPLIDRYVRPKPYGYIKPPKEKKEKKTSSSKGEDKK